MNWVSDNPIESHLEDKLNFKKSATVLTKFILKSDTPISIGINGKWGSGKTSLMRLIEENLNDEAEILISRFDTWKYSNEKEIWRVLMLSLIDDLDPDNENKYDTTNLISGILDIGFIASKALLSSGVTLFADKDHIVESFEKLKNVEKSREEEIMKNELKTVKTFRKELEKLIDKTLGDNGKYIIFIDDLDRIIPEKVVEIIEAIKTFLNCKRCVFIIGCDYDYIDKCFESKYSKIDFSGKNYIDKIIQISFNVPRMAPNFNYFLNSYIQDFFYLQEDFNKCGELIKKSIGENPRNIKRFINLYNIIYVVNENELDDIVLFKLLCFMVKWPELYEKSIQFNFNDKNKNRKNKFVDFEEWALELMTFEEYLGVPDDIIREQKMETEPPNEQEEYDRYQTRLTKIKKEVEEEITSARKNSDKENMKQFFCTYPYFKQVKNFNQYLILLDTIDQKSVRIADGEMFKNGFKMNEIDNLIDEIIKLFKGQSIDGKHFNQIQKITLPNSSNIEKIPSIIIGDKMQFEWGFKRIERKLDLSIDYFERFNDTKYERRWYISSWKIPKSIIKYIQENDNILLSDISSLKDISEHLK